MEAFCRDIVVTPLVGRVIVTAVAAWLCKKLPHRVMGILIGILLVLLNVRTLFLTFSASRP